MWLKYILLNCFLVGSTTLFGQVNKISCDLINLYHLTINKNPVIQRLHIQNSSVELDKQFAVSLFDYQLFANLSVSKSGLNLFNADSRRDLVGNQIKTNNMVLSSGVQKKFRSGLTANTAINYSRVADNFPFNAFDENVGSFMSNNNTNLSFSVSQPLLKGGGRHITTANERIATKTLERQLYNSSFIASRELFYMIDGYWEYLGAYKGLEALKSNVVRIKKVLTITEELVQADKLPASDLIQIRADLKDIERRTIDIQQVVFRLRQNLARHVGFNVNDSEFLSAPVNDFPALETVSTEITLEQLISIAHQNRSDLKTLEKSLEIAYTNVEIAKNKRKPQLDVTAFVSYGGVDEGNGLNRFLSALGQHEGRNYQVGVDLSYVFPVNNNFAEAELLHNELEYNDQILQINNQIRNIELNVSIAYTNFVSNMEALKKSRQSVEYYEEVFRNEQIKFQTGLTTLLNLSILQARLNSAQLANIHFHELFIRAIANLRFQTGTLITHDQISIQNRPIDLDFFYSLPK